MRKDPTEFGKRFAKWKETGEYELPRFEGGNESVRVGDYNVHPSAIGASELNVTTPEVVVTGTDKRPAYLRYDAEHSTYDPNAIRNFTDWAPVVGDIGTGIDIKNAIDNQNYLEAGILGGMMVLPDPIARGAKKLFRPAIKKVNRFFGKIDWQDPLLVKVPEAENQTWAEITAAKYADKIAHKNLVRASDRDREIFKTGWKIATRNNPARSVEELTHGFTFASEKDKYRFVDLVNRNPEYYEFLRRGGIKDPLAQENVSRFLDNLFTSVRGVVANTPEEAYPMLTTTEYGRHMSGGDRLDTKGGIYTSNSTTIADRFKNPQGNKVGTGYVAKLRYPHNIPIDIPIEDQLEQYRKKVLLSDSKNPLFGTSYYLEQKANPDVIALESDYVGRAAFGDKSALERAYLPKDKSGNSEKTLDVLDLQEYKNQHDTHGRWLARPEDGSKAGLFIPRALNNYSDFVRSARVVLKPKPDYKLYKQTEDQALETFRSQWDKRHKLLSNIHQKRNKVKNKLALASVAAASSPFLYGAYSLLKDDGFYDSPEYDRMTSDPDYIKALNNEDSLKTVEKKYIRLYHERLREEKHKKYYTRNEPRNK